MFGVIGELLAAAAAATASLQDHRQDNQEETFAREVVANVRHLTAIDPEQTALLVSRLASRVGAITTAGVVRLHEQVVNLLETHPDLQHQYLRSLFSPHKYVLFLRGRMFIT